MNRLKFLGTFFAFSLLVLTLPTLASAQYRGVYDNDDYYRNNRRAVEDAVRRVHNNSKNFRRTLDRALDRSRYDDRRIEDRILDVAKDFERAADRLEDNYRGGRDLNRSANEARNLLQVGNQLDRFVYSRGRQLDYSVQNSWSQMSADLRFIANAYNLNFNGGYNNNRNDDYRRDRRDRNDYPRSNNGRWGRFPFPN